MERMTYRFEDGKVTVDCTNCPENPNNNPDGKCGPLRCVDRLKNRVGAYENTGLEPEEIKRVLDAYGREMTLRTESAQRLEIIKDITAARLRELAQADKEGRCVVLPCKIGIPIYYWVDKGTKYQTLFTKPFRVSDAERIGEKYFLTREDAEAALRREQDG